MRILAEQSSLQQPLVVVVMVVVEAGPALRTLAWDVDTCLS